MQSARREHVGKTVLSPLPMSPADSLIMARGASQSETTRYKQDTQLNVDSDKRVYLYYIHTSHTCLKKIHLFAIQM